MDSEKVIIESIKPLLKDYLTFTRGKLPKDWVNVRDERQRDVERVQREIEDLDNSINMATKFNEEMEDKAMPSLKVWKPGTYEEVKDDIKENKEKIESDKVKRENARIELAQAQYELEQSQKQIEERRQAKIAKIKRDIRYRVQQDMRARQYIEENQVGIRENQTKLDGLENYGEISDEQIEKFACIVEKQEKEEQKTAKIEEIRQDLVKKEEKYKDLLTEDYYLVREEYIKQLQSAKLERIEKLEETIKLVSVQTIYKKVYKNALEQKNQTRADAILEIMQKIEDRKQKEKAEKRLEKDANEIAVSKEDTFMEKIQNSKLVRGITKIVTKEGRKELAASAKEMFHNIGIRIGNWSMGMKLLGDGNEKVVISEEQINTTYQRNKEKRAQQLKDIAVARQNDPIEQSDFILPRVEMSEQEVTKRVIRSREEEIEKQLREAKGTSANIDGLMKAGQDVVVRVNEQQIQKYRQYRKKEEETVVAMPKKQEAKQLQTDSDSEPVQRKNIEKRINDGFIIPEVLKRDNVRAYKETLNGGISLAKQKENTGRFFQRRKTKGEIDQPEFKEVSFE